VTIAIVGDRLALDDFHHEVRTPGVGRTRIEHLGDVRVVHHRQSLPLSLEAGDNLLRVHPRLDDLQGHTASHRAFLFRQVDNAEPSFAKSAQELIRSDTRTDVMAGYCPSQQGTPQALPARSQRVLELVDQQVGKAAAEVTSDLWFVPQQGRGI